nr:MAG TPA: hypothetical protein [Caudoviricetes sp.]
MKDLCKLILIQLIIYYACELFLKWDKLINAILNFFR